MTNLKEDSTEKHGQIRPAPELVFEADGSGGPRGSLAKFNVSPQAVRALPADFVKRHRVLPLEIHNGTIHIATADPGNQRVIDDIRLLSGLEVQESVAPASEILEKIAQCYQVTVEQMIENLNPERGPNVESKDLHDIEVMANEPTVVNLVNVIISTALRKWASDIHLVRLEDTLQLRADDGLPGKSRHPPNNSRRPGVPQDHGGCEYRRTFDAAGWVYPDSSSGARGYSPTMPMIYGESLQCGCRKAQN
jgi:hypothetical protein